MIVNKNKLAQIMFVNCVVNIIADDEVLKYRYSSNSNTWFCNGEDTNMNVLELLEYLTSKYTQINVRYKRQC